MNLKKLRGTSLLGLFLLIPLLLSSCNMMGIDSPFTFVADGGSLTAKMAIASGDPTLMLQCLARIASDYNSGNLSSAEMGEAALDMIDLLAVLSRVINAVIPIIVDNKVPDDYYADAEQFLNIADINYLADIADDSVAADLINHALSADPTALQYFWMAMGLYAWYYLSGALESLDQDSYDYVIDRVNEAQLVASDAGNTEVVDLLEWFETEFSAYDPSLP